MISVVIPVFNNESSLQIVVDEIVTALKLYSNNSEIILVDDASHDNSLSLAKSLQKTYPAVKCIALPQNKGQHYAIYKGLKKAKGDWVIVMDADGQDNPSLIPTLVAETQNSLDAILIARQNRKSSVLDLLTNAIFYWLWQMLGNKKANANVSNFGIYKRSIVDAILATKFPPFSLPSFNLWSAWH